MNTTETIKTIQRVSIIWPSFRLPEDPDKFDVMVETWEEFLGTYSYDEVKLAMDQNFMRSKFPPSLPELASALTRLGQPSDAEAMEQARKWGRYLDQQQFANGSGYTPVCPPDVHEEVQRIMGAIGINDDSWERSFKFAWKDR